MPLRNKDNQDTQGAREPGLSSSEHSHLSLVVLAAILIVGVLHFVGRYAFLVGLSGPVASELLTASAFLILSCVMLETVWRVYTLPLIKGAFAAGVVIILLVEAMRVVEAAFFANRSSFAAAALLDAAREGMFALGIALFMASFYACLLEANRARNALEAEKRELLREVQERKQAEEALRESTASLQGIYDAMADGLAVADLETKAFLRVNRSFCDMLGYSEAELMTMGVLDIHPPETLQETLVHFDALAHRQQRVAQDVPCLRRDGSVFFADIAAYPHAFRGRPCCIGLFRDVTETRAVKEELRQLNTELEARVRERTSELSLVNARLVAEIAERAHAERVVDDQQLKMINAARMSALGLMAGGIAHEINNPLAILSAGAQQLETVLRNPTPDMDRVYKVCATLMRNVERIHRIVRALRSLSREGSGDPFAATSIREILMDSLELCQERFKRHGIGLLLPEIAGDTLVECRASQLSQVILNLLNNACDAVETGIEKWIRVEVESDNNTVAITITNSGPPISRELEENIFLPFFSTKEQGKGIGLGLSISKRIIEDHLGTLEVDHGCANTRFVVSVPLIHPSETSGARRVDAVLESSL